MGRVGRSRAFGGRVRHRRAAGDSHPADRAETEQIVDWVGLSRARWWPAYEAGPTGFGLARALTAAGVRCEVVAPSKIERPAGDKVKTDRRDAERLARLLRIGELPGVRVPTEAEEAARDLVRAREDSRGDLMRARHRLSKLLLRQGLVWDHTAWTGAHERLAAQPPLRSARGAARLRRGPRHGVHRPRAPQPARRRDRRDGRDRRRWPGRSGGCAACEGSRR